MFTAALPKVSADKLEKKFDFFIVVSRQRVEQTVVRPRENIIHRQWLCIISLKILQIYWKEHWFARNHLFLQIFSIFFFLPSN